MNIIHYGISKDYLPNWTKLDALREFYQNFLDFGHYNISIKEESENLLKVSLSNHYRPISEEFLQIGTSYKRDNPNTIGGHGEGLKMGLMIMLREGFMCNVYTKDILYIPVFTNNGGIDNCFAIEKHTNANIHDLEDILDIYDTKDNSFIVTFYCDAETFNAFNDTIIKDSDIIFTDSSNGSIVNREPGMIFSGKMFISKVTNLKHAYDLNPNVLTLDRDRKTPTTFDVNWHSARILEKYAKFTAEDTTYSDTEYIDELPDNFTNNVVPRRIGSDAVFSYRKDGEDHVITNRSVINILKKDENLMSRIPYNKPARKHNFRKGVKGLLIDFKNKYLTEDSNEYEDLVFIIKRLESTMIKKKRR